MTVAASALATSLAGKTTLSIIVPVSVCHLTIYPILKVDYGLDYVQIGLSAL